MELADVQQHAALQIGTGQRASCPGQRWIPVPKWRRGETGPPAGSAAADGASERTQARLMTRNISADMLVKPQAALAWVTLIPCHTTRAWHSRASTPTAQHPAVNPLAVVLRYARTCSPVARQVQQGGERGEEGSGHGFGGCVRVSILRPFVPICPQGINSRRS